MKIFEVVADRVIPTPDSGGSAWLIADVTDYDANAVTAFVKSSRG